MISYQNLIKHLIKFEQVSCLYCYKFDEIKVKSYKNGRFWLKVIFIPCLALDY